MGVAVEVLPLHCAKPQLARQPPPPPGRPPATHHAAPEIQGECAGILEWLFPLKRNQIRTCFCPLGWGGPPHTLSLPGRDGVARQTLSQPQVPPLLVGT